MRNLLPLFTVAFVTVLTFTIAEAQCNYQLQSIVTKAPSSCGASDAHACVLAYSDGTVYKFKWSNGYTSFSTSESCAQNLASGSYVVEVTGFGGCDNWITIVVPDVCSERDERREEAKPEEEKE